MSNMCNICDTWIISLGCAERVRKGNKNLSGNWGGEGEGGGESRV